MEYDVDRVAAFVDEAVRRSDPENRPSFYAIAGSHVYGFPSGDSDVDVRGFHLADCDRYVSLDEPAEQVVVNQGAPDEGFERYAEIDLVSYELKKFGRLLYEANFNALEVVFDGIRVVDEVPDRIDSLRTLVERHLPLDVPNAYLGMARTNYVDYLDPNRPSFEPEAKRYLYVLRGLLAARYVLDEETITADVRTLSRHVLGSTTVVDDLVDAKQSAGATVDDDLVARADELIDGLFDSIDPPEHVDKDRYRQRLDEWMLAVRR